MDSQQTDNRKNNSQRAPRKHHRIYHRWQGRPTTSTKNYAVGKQTTGKAKEVLAGIAEKIYKKEVIERQKIHRISIYSIEILCM